MSVRLVVHVKSGNVADDLVKFMHVCVEYPLVVQVVALAALVHSRPRYLSLAGIVIGKQFESVEPHEQLSSSPLESVVVDTPAMSCVKNCPKIGNK
jgi:hypothetical protein